jgi:hypothetical protein
MPSPRIIAIMVAPAEQSTATLQREMKKLAADADARAWVYEQMRVSRPDWTVLPSAGHIRWIKGDRTIWRTRDNPHNDPPFSLSINEQWIPKLFDTFEEAAAWDGV